MPKNKKREVKFEEIDRDEEIISNALGKFVGKSLAELAHFLDCECIGIYGSYSQVDEYMQSTGSLQPQMDSIIEEISSTHIYFSDGSWMATVNSASQDNDKVEAYLGHKFNMQDMLPEDHFYYRMPGENSRRLVNMKERHDDILDAMIMATSISPDIMDKLQERARSTGPIHAKLYMEELK